MKAAHRHVLLLQLREDNEITRHTLVTTRLLLPGDASFRPPN